MLEVWGLEHSIDIPAASYAVTLAPPNYISMAHASLMAASPLLFACLPFADMHVLAWYELSPGFGLLPQGMHMAFASLELLQRL